MHALILYDEPKAGAGLDDLDVLEQVATVAKGLAELGHTSSTLGLAGDVAAIASALAAHPSDLVFNLVESVGGKGRLIHLVPALCTALGRTLTGASSEAVFATSNKLIGKRMLISAQLPTPSWYTLGDLESCASFAPGTYIVKSLWEHASIGLDEDSVVEVATAGELTEEIRARLQQIGGEGFAERYVDGREFNLSLIGDSDRGKPRTLPPAEIVFEGYGPDKPKVVGYRAKWESDSHEFTHTPRRFEFPGEDAELLMQLEQLAVRAWHLFELSGWARVDMRVDSSGQPWILEVNTNPCLSPDAGFAAALDRAGISLHAALDLILRDTVTPIPGS